LIYVNAQAAVRTILHSLSQEDAALSMLTRGSGVSGCRDRSRVATECVAQTAPPG